MDAEIMKYVSEAYPKGICSVYCTKGKDVEEPGSDFELVVVISAARHSPQNFWCVGFIKTLTLTYMCNPLFDFDHFYDKFVTHITTWCIFESNL